VTIDSLEGLVDMMASKIAKFDFDARCQMTAEKKQECFYHYMRQKGDNWPAGPSPRTRGRRIKPIFSLHIF
jgi:hypothetical protein